MPKSSKIPAVRFNLKSHDSKIQDSEVLIILVFRYLRKRLVWSTGEKVKPRYWNSGRAKYTNRHPEYSELNSRLNELEELTKNIFKENGFGKISIQDFKQELAYRSGKQERPIDSSKQIPSFFEFIEDYISKRNQEPNAKINTLKKFPTAFNHLKTYATEKGIKLDYDDIDWNFKKDFSNWLYSPPRNHSINTAAKTFKIVKQFLREAYRLGYHKNDIVNDKGFGIKQVKAKNKVRLSFEELDKLRNLDLSDNEKLARVRDLFLVGCYTGLRFSDWNKIQREHIKMHEGVELLEVITQKTGTKVIIPFLPELEDILKKYNYNLPKISNQKFNEYIKQVCKLALKDRKFLRVYSEGGIQKDETIEKWKKISSHAARRSFATNFFEMGHRIVGLMQITGHSSEKQFFEYIDLDGDKLALQFAKRRKEQRMKAQ